MSNLSEEVYLKKYLKYKKKYMLALEEMKGGVLEEMKGGTIEEMKGGALDEKTKIYFVCEETFKSIQAARPTTTNPSKCFEERLKKPHISLILEKSMTGGWNLTTFDEKKKKVKVIANKPFLGGLKFGIKQKIKQGTNETEIIEESFNAGHAESQLKEYRNYILDCLKHANPRKEEVINKVFYLFVKENTIEYIGELTPSSQVGGADPKYIFCDEGGLKSLQQHYGKLEKDILVNVDTSCIEDIVKHPKETGDKNKYGILKIGEEFIIIDETPIKFDTPKKIKFGYGEEKGKTLFSRKNVLEQKKSIDALPDQITTIISLLGSYKINHAIEYTEKYIKLKQ
jgi:hypothetical protein